MSNNIALVVGGSGALGTGALALLSERGIKTIVATHRRKVVSSKIKTKVDWIHYDSECQGGIDSLQKAIGECRINFFLFTCGEASSKQTIVDTDLFEWNRLWRSNVISFIEIYKSLHNAIRHGRCRVLVISSDTTKKLGLKNGPYSASKAALEATVKTLAKEEAAYGVRINVLAPSLFESPLANHILTLKNVADIDGYKRSLPWGRPISLKEVSEVAVSILCDEKWDYASGQIFRLGSE